MHVGLEGMRCFACWEETGHLRTCTEWERVLLGSGACEYCRRGLCVLKLWEIVVC